MNAAFDSRASPVRRTATAREIGGAESSTTSENAALRSNTSAHHAACAAAGGRTIHRVVCPSSAQSRGASVRDASMYATHSPRSTAASTTCRSNVSLPVAPTTSLSRPRGSPADARALSSAANPVGSPGAVGSGGGSSARSDSTDKAGAVELTLDEERWAVATAVELTANSIARFEPLPEERPKTWGGIGKPSTVAPLTVIHTLSTLLHQNSNTSCHFFAGDSCSLSSSSSSS